MPLISCPYCGRVHSYDFDCGRRRKYGTQSPTAENKFRHSKAWGKKSLQIRARDRFMCLYCYRHDKRINTERIEVHHIVPIHESFDNRLDDFNLISLCREHHEQAETGKIDRDYLFDLVSDSIAETQA